MGSVPAICRERWLGYCNSGPINSGTKRLPKIGSRQLCPRNNFISIFQFRPRKFVAQPTPPPNSSRKPANLAAACLPSSTADNSQVWNWRPQLILLAQPHAPCWTSIFGTPIICNSFLSPPSVIVSPCSTTQLYGTCDSIPRCYSVNDAVDEERLQKKKTRMEGVGMMSTFWVHNRGAPENYFFDKDGKNGNTV